MITTCSWTACYKGTVRYSRVISDIWYMWKRGLFSLVSILSPLECQQFQEFISYYNKPLCILAINNISNQHINNIHESERGMLTRNKKNILISKAFVIYLDKYSYFYYTFQIPLELMLQSTSLFSIFLCSFKISFN